MDQIKLLRASGQPVILEHLESFRLASNEAFDRVCKEHGLTEQTKYTPELSEKISKILRDEEALILAKYPVHSMVDFPVTEEAWKELVRQYGPVAVAADASTGSLALIIMDAQFGG